MRVALSIWLCCLMPVLLQAQQYEDILKNRKVHLYEGQDKVEFRVIDFTRSPKPDKLYHWYGTQQVRTTMGGYSGRVLHGTYTRYYPSNDLAESGSFKNGLKHGQWYSWYPNGLKQRESMWKAGEQSGPFRIWNEEGLLLEDGQMRQNRRQGKITAWNMDTGGYMLQYFDRGQEITKEQYEQRNMFSRTGNYIGKQWQKLFRKKSAAND